MQQVLAQTPYPNRPASRFSGSSTPRSHRSSRATCWAACAASAVDGTIFEERFHLLAAEIAK